MVVAATTATAEPVTVSDVAVSAEESVTLDTKFALAGRTAPDADSGDEVTALGRYGSTFPRDSDGSVPEHFGSWTGCSDGTRARPHQGSGHREAPRSDNPAYAPRARIRGC